MSLLRGVRVLCSSKVRVCCVLRCGELYLLALDVAPASPFIPSKERAQITFVVENGKR
jgi:hypothetical protein